jgi:uncharacterized membrane protein
METNVMKNPNSESDASMVPPATGSTNININETERILSVLTGAAASVYGLRNLKSPTGIALALSGSYLLLRGFSGYCAINQAIGRNTVNKKASAMEVKETFVVNRPRAEVYAFWRRLGNLPLFMKYLEEVTEKDGLHSTWKAAVPGGLGTITWEAEITEDRPGELITWASLPGSTIDNAGEINFQDAPNNQGTEIRAHITYRLPAGDVGSLAGKLFNPLVENMMKEDLRRFKSIIETGEIPTSESSSESEDSETKRKGRKSRQLKKEQSTEEG